MTRQPSKLSFWLLALSVIANWWTVTGVIDAAEMGVVGNGDVEDPFARLRVTERTPREDYWHRVGQGLQQLASIEGAAYDPQFGVLTLHGPPATGHGPYHLDDLMVALRAVYFENESLGMTIDPDPADPHGPEMIVRYFGGCENTAFGWVLFECDRLLKSISHGKDNLTGLPVKPNVPDFFDALELSAAISSPRSGQWNRFWLALDSQDAPSWREQPRTSNGTQPVVCELADKSAISLASCRVYLRTEVMQLRGGKMIPVPGATDKAARRFADHFTHYYDEFADQFPEYKRLKDWSRLVVLAEWIEQAGVPMDVEFIRSYRPSVSVRTPKRTPSSTVERETIREAPGGFSKQQITSIGGVDIEPRTFFAIDAQGEAAKHKMFSQAELASNAKHVAWKSNLQGRPTQVVVIPTLNTRLKRLEDSVALATEFRPVAGEESPGSSLPRKEVTSLRPERVMTERISLSVLDRERQHQDAPPVPPAASVVLFDNRADESRNRATSPEDSATSQQVGTDHPGRGPPSPPSEIPSDATSPRDSLGPTAERSDRVRREAEPLVVEPDVRIEPPRPPPSPTVTSERADRTKREAAALTGDRGASSGLPSSSPSNSPTDAVSPRDSSGATAERSDRVRRDAEPLVAEPDLRIELPRPPPSPIVASERADRTKRETVSLTGSGDRPWGLPIFQTSTNEPTYNLPRLIQFANPRQRREISIQGLADSKTQVPDQVALVSELGDISVQFGEPQIDQARRMIVFPDALPEASGLLGYYPQSRSVEFSDGSSIAFDQNGFPQQMNWSSGLNVKFQYAQDSPSSDWPRPVSCSVVSENDRARSGAYDLVARHSIAPSPLAETITPATAPTSLAPATPTIPANPNRDADSPQQPETGAPVPPETADAADAFSFAFRSDPARLNEIAIAEGQLIGGSIVLDTPFEFVSGSKSGTWKARLRSRYTPTDVNETNDWAGDEVVLSASDGSLLRISLNQDHGEFQKDQAQTVRLVATRMPRSGQREVSGQAEFYLDVVGQAEDADVQRQSLPIRLTVGSDSGALAGFLVVVFIAVAIGSLCLALVVGARRVG